MPGHDQSHSGTLRIGKGATIPRWILMILISSADDDVGQSAVDRLNRLKAVLSAKGPHWSAALQNWTCPTPAATSNGSCDPCGAAQWWGNWAFLGCRGQELKREFYQM